MRPGGFRLAQGAAGRSTASDARALRLLDLAPIDQVLAYLRPAGRRNESIVVLSNYGSTPINVMLPRDVRRAVAPNHAVVDLARDERLDADALTLPAYVRILQRAPERAGE